MKPVAPFLDWDESFKYSGFTERVRWLQARQYLLHPSKRGLRMENGGWYVRDAETMYMG